MSKPVRSRTPRRSRLVRGARIALVIASASAWTAVGFGETSVAAAEPEGSANLLDHPRIDVAELDSTGPDGAPRVLVVDPVDPATGRVRVAVLVRDGAWSIAAAATVDLAAAGLDGPGEPWLVGLGDDQFVLIATSESSGRTVFHHLDAGPLDGAASIELRPPVRLEAVVDDAGAADVDADGVLDLVVANARTLRQGGTCQGSTIWVFRDGDLASHRELAIDGVRLAAGVFGSLDDVAGDDLAAYAYPNCPAGPDRGTELRLMAINLADRSVIVDRPAAAAQVTPWIAPPIRFDADSDGRHELLALVPRGLAVLDPMDGWSDIRVATAAAMPLGSTMVAGPPGEPRIRVAWLEPAIEGRGSIGTELVRRDALGSLDTGPATVRWDTPTPSDRWRALLADAMIGTLRQGSPVAWNGVLGDPSCPDLLVPTVMVECGSDAVVPSATWVGTRPLLAFDSPSGRRLLVAAGIQREAGFGLPTSPRPWAGGAMGRWRHGPDAPFALAEVDTAGLSDPVVPVPIVDRTAARGPVAVVGTRVGMRLVATAFARGPDASEPMPDPILATVLDMAPLPGGISSMARIPVPRGVASSSQGAVTELPLVDATMADGSAAERWALFVVAIDDVGDLAAPVAVSVRQDLIGPTVALSAPVTSPIWPVPARLTGVAEIGATVTVEGAGEVSLGDRGSFTLETTLAPWPQTIRVVATDAVGNTTVHEVTVVGGFDYRTLPWPGIMAVVVLAAAVVSGVVGSRRRRGGTAMGPAGHPVAGEPGPELEDLPSPRGLDPG